MEDLLLETVPGTPRGVRILRLAGPFEPRLQIEDALKQLTLTLRAPQLDGRILLRVEDEARVVVLDAGKKIYDGPVRAAFGWRTRACR